MGLLCLYFTGQLKSGQETGEREGMTCSKGPQVESNLGPLREDTASVYGASALPTEPLGAPFGFLIVVKFAAPSDPRLACCTRPTF